MTDEFQDMSVRNSIRVSKYNLQTKPKTKENNKGSPQISYLMPTFTLY